jgi:acyl-CoA synthetase (AMP-forming)/AMP-acid ligase II
MRVALEDGLVASPVSRDFPVWSSSPSAAQQTTMAAFLRCHDLADLDALLRRADAEPEWYWHALLQFFDIRFARPYAQVLDLSKGIEMPRWCIGGTTNVVLRIVPGMWVQGDLASRDVDGAWYLHGRSDDTIKIAGKRTGPSEIEMALLATDLVADAVVVAVSDAIAGSALACACVPLTPVDDAAKLAQRLARAVAENFGASYRPKRFIFVAELPRTRNQKVMRRVVRSVLAGTPLGDLSSLANPESIELLRSQTIVGIEELTTAAAAASNRQH